MDTKGILSADTDEDRIGTIYHNIAGWLMEQRTPVAYQDNGGKEMKYRLRYVYDPCGNKWRFIVTDYQTMDRKATCSQNKQKHLTVRID